MDFFSEFMSIKDEEFLTGTYYPRRPKTTADGGEEFSYGIVDLTSREHRTILGALETDGATTAIKTRAAIKFKVNGYVVSQGGELWQISGVSTDYAGERNKEALRLFKNSAQTEKILRLIEVDNPMELE